MILVNLDKQDKNAKSSSLRYRMYLANMKDVDVENFPKAINATISVNVLKPGAVFKYVDAQTNSIKPATQVGESPYNGKLEIPFIIEGISGETLSWSYENQGEDFVGVWVRCADNQCFIAGDPCSGGLRFSYDTIGALDGGISGISGKLTGGECPEPIWLYDGPIPLESGDIIPEDASTFALSAKFQYQLSDNTADTTLTDITNVTASDIGRIIEITGAGVQNPTKITASSKFILKDGLDFMATLNSKISFLIIKADVGYAFMEMHRA